jgi:outer membrane receptor protein involved in Fe transport
MCSRLVVVCALALAGDATADDLVATTEDEEVIEVTDELPSPAPGRATSRVTRAELDERQPRSAPDALRWEPGVYVQQTSAAQGSVFLRGRTGQQTVLLFDGVRLNNSLWRQGPNQYFSSVDTRVLAGIDVIRGGASTRFGSDAIGGVLDAIPRDPVPGPRGVAPRAELRWGSADHEMSARVELAARVPRDGAVLVGFGARDASLVESGGPVAGVDGGAVAQVPRFAADGRTQLGTGFTELAWDLRWVQPVRRHRVTVGYYDDRILDAPRTDQCAPAFAPANECLRIEEQFHTLLYAALDANDTAVAERARVTVSVQEQHERSLRDRPSSFIQNGGRDDVRTVGLAGQAVSRSRSAGPATLRFGWGGDAYLDFVDSTAWLTFTDVGQVIYDTRGQYLAGSRYLNSGMFAEPQAQIGRVTLRAGGRIGAITADAPGDVRSATTAIDRRWWTEAGYAGAAIALGDVELRATLDRSFRAPNLDDLTGRQAAGPGFQFENAQLGAESAWTAEVGARIRRRGLTVEAWTFGSRVHGAITRSLRQVEDCPPNTPGCNASWFRYQLVNLDGAARIVGVEGQMTATAGDAAVGEVTARTTVSATHGAGPDDVPLSRIPPVNGTLEVTARRDGAWLGAAVRWARAQTRLAPADRGDPRIPDGGTPGYAVVELRGGFRIGTHSRLGIVLENLGDAAYRHHGSSINGPGRSVVVHLQLTP